jgi:hypothetical protein
MMVSVISNRPPTKRLNDPSGSLRTQAPELGQPLRDVIRTQAPCIFLLCCSQHINKAAIYGHKMIEATLSIASLHDNVQGREEELDGKRAVLRSLSRLF